MNATSLRRSGSTNQDDLLWNLHTQDIMAKHPSTLPSAVRHAHRPAGWLSVLAIAALLAACGGGGDSSPPAPVAGTVTPTASVTPVPDPPTLQLQLPDLSGLTPQAAAAFAFINEARLRYGQGVLNPDPLLQKAAQDHSDWIANAESIPEGAHYQVPGTPGFTGYAPWDRIRNAGYIAYNSSEVLSAISENAVLRTPKELGESFIKGQLNSVYHRFGILGPWRDAGYG